MGGGVLSGFVLVLHTFSVPIKHNFLRHVYTLHSASCILQTNNIVCSQESIIYTHSIAKILDIAKRCKTFKYTVNISVMEIYCNELRDLLCPVQQKLVIKNGKKWHTCAWVDICRKCKEGEWIARYFVCFQYII